MNALAPLNFESSYLDCSIQVLLLAATLLALQLLIPRKDVRGRAFILSLGTLLVAALTLLTFARPADWISELDYVLPLTGGDGKPTLSAGVKSTDLPPTSVDQPGFTISLPIDKLADAMPTAIQTTASFNAVRWAITTCILLAFLRLGASVIWWHARVRQAKPIHEMRLKLLSENLQQQFAMSRPVDVRELDGIPTAATFGIYRPVILLSCDWQTWSDTELKAVLAHEMAHVHRGDYRYRLVSEICCVVHLCNPLVRLCCRSLRFAQETSADEVAASMIGDRNCYARSLAALALRQDNQRLPSAAFRFSPVLCFSPFRPSTLIRRIEMLRTKEGHVQSKEGFVRYVAVAILLLTVGVSVAPIRCLAENEGSSKRTNSDQGTDLERSHAKSDETPFNLSYIDSTSEGIVAIRFARLFRRPELKTLSDIAWKQSWDAIVREPESFPPELAVRFDSVEQITGPINLEHDPAKDKAKNQLSFALSFLQMTKAFDFPALFSAITETEPTLKNDEQGKRLEGVRLPGLGLDATFLLPDDRSLACRAELNQSDTDPTEEKPFQLHDQWQRGWNSVKDADVAVLLDNRKGAWSRALADAPIQELSIPWEKAAFGFSFGQQLDVRILVSCADDDSAIKAAQQAPTIITACVTAEIKKAVPNNERVNRLLDQMVRTAQITRSGDEVVVILQPEFDATEVLSAIFSPMITGENAAVAQEDSKRLTR